MKRPIVPDADYVRRNGFPGGIAGASLKLAVVEELQTFIEGFPGGIAGASLKQFLFIIWITYSFRGCPGGIAGASLKLFISISV